MFNSEGLKEKGFPTLTVVDSCGLKWVGACEEVGDRGLRTSLCDGQTLVGKGLMC